MEGLIQATFPRKRQQWGRAACTYLKMENNLKMIQCLEFSGGLVLSILLEIYYGGSLVPEATVGQK